MKMMNEQSVKLFEQVMQSVTADHLLHARWLNTLSMMENTGARKIARNEHPVHTTLTILKHAAEEARHAYYLKKQIGKLGTGLCPDYSQEFLLAPMSSYLYLHRLDADVCRMLKKQWQFSADEIRQGAYLLVTYAIEVRADVLYGIYQEQLDKTDSKVNVKSIILEEDGHLEEMTSMLQQFHEKWEVLAADACLIEEALFQNWVEDIIKEVPLPDHHA